jgi:RNA methyltransferase, TrmH family
MPKVITSRENPLYKHLKHLVESGRQRRVSGQTLLDGEHLLRVYLDRVGPPLALILRQSAVGNLPRLTARPLKNVERIVLADSLFDALSPVQTPTGVLTQIEIPPQRAYRREFCLLLEDIQDPGNLGAMLRSAAAAGVDTVYLSKGCADAWSPKVLRGGQGAHFFLGLVEHADLLQVIPTLPAVVATDARAVDTLYDLDLTGPVAFAFGNEGAGLSPALMAAARRRVRIPMPGDMESLNAAAAAAVCVFERVRQRQQPRHGLQ